ncbi:hypothetical protein [Streptomyces sedi]|uniref:hypothetical protein n=1 Tax=Streptomyces sedi TaxID=555059 RepID=UPI0031E8257A
MRATADERERRGALGWLAWLPWVVLRGLTRMAVAAWWWGARGRRRLPAAAVAVALGGVALWLPAVGAWLVAALVAGAAALGWREATPDWCAPESCADGAVEPEGGAAGGWPAEVVAQRFVAGVGEVVLGCTDRSAADRTVPAVGAGGVTEVAPLLWRTGPRSGEPHLLAVGAPGAGGTGLLRAVALQALGWGEAVLVDGGGSGGFGCFAGRAGVWGVESTPEGAVTGLAWVARETERRLLLDVGERAELPPLWLLVDRPVLLAHRAWAAGAGDPSGWLDVPLRYGREAGVTVALAEQVGVWERLGDGVLGCLRARVALGALDGAQVSAVLGRTPPGAAGAVGAGYARLGAGPVCRLRVPATPDPWDDAAEPEHRRAVWRLLPAPSGTGVEQV